MTLSRREKNCPWFRVLVLVPAIWSVAVAGRERVPVWSRRSRLATKPGPPQRRRCRRCDVPPLTLIR